MSHIASLLFLPLFFGVCEDLAASSLLRACMRSCMRSSCYLRLCLSSGGALSSKHGFRRPRVLLHVLTRLCLGLASRLSVYSDEPTVVLMKSRLWRGDGCLASRTPPLCSSPPFHSPPLPSPPRCARKMEHGGDISGVPPRATAGGRHARRSDALGEELSHRSRTHARALALAEASGDGGCE